MICQQHTSSTVIQGDENYSITIMGDHVNGLVNLLRYKDQCIAVTTLIPNSNRTCRRYDQVHCYTNCVSEKNVQCWRKQSYSETSIHFFLPQVTFIFFPGSEKSPFCTLFYLNTDININFICLLFLQA
jgi:hypothetical protein